MLLSRIILIIIILLNFQQVLSYEENLICKDEECFIKKSNEMFDNKEYSKAISFLKEGVSQFPNSKRINIMLGVAYLKNNNDFWGIKVLNEQIEKYPDDCETIFWLAFAYFKQASMESAKDVIESSKCLPKEAEKTRLSILKSLILYHLQEKNNATVEFINAKNGKNAFLTDIEVLPIIREKFFYNTIPDFEWRGEISFGYTSNALMGSPLDLALTDKEGESTFLNFSGWFRFIPQLKLPITPSSEFQIRVSDFFSEDVENLSFTNPSGRLGFFIEKIPPRLFLGYKIDYLLLFHGDRYTDSSLWYYGTHRGEAEFEINSYLLLFAGVGKRTFREMAKTRTELDFGGGGNIPALKPLNILWAVSGRYYKADNSAYNQYGGSVIGGFNLKLPKNFLIRDGLTFAYDYYPDSKGYPLFLENENRKDKFLKNALSLWFPNFYKMRSGITYEFSNRNSSVSQYTFSSHKVFIGLVWSGNYDIFIPSVDSSKPLVDIDWEMKKEGGTFNERIQDLLRQDEQVQRSSSCIQ